MSEPCFLCDSVAVPVGGLLHLDGPEGHHAAAVRRVRLGEILLIADGRGKAVRGPVENIGDGFIDLRVHEQLAETPPVHHWTVVQALAKSGRDESAVAMLTELGVTEIIAWQAARSVVRWENKTGKGLAKWCTTAREAAKQARRFTVPQISAATTDEICHRITTAAQAFVLHEAADSYLAAQPLPVAGEILFIVGPEGGISPEELAQFEAAGATPALLAEHVLRTSTAGVVALAQAQAMTVGRPSDE